MPEDFAALAAVQIPFRSTALVGACMPAFGGRLSRLAAVTPTGVRELIVPMEGWTSVSWRWPKSGAYPLIPFSNRIRDAQLQSGHDRHALQPHPDAAPHALHGPAHLRSWDIAAVSDNAVAMTLDYRADADWPWHFQAHTVFTLADAGLRIEMSVMNRSDDACPAGLGWHPYLLFGPGARLRHDARTLWSIDAAVIATGAQAPVGATQARTEYLSEWRSAQLIAADGAVISLTADPIFAHLICYRPESDAYACIEPVTHVSDGFNLAARGVAGTGTRWLQPGETLAGAITLHYHAPDAARRMGGRS